MTRRTVDNHSLFDSLEGGRRREEGMDRAVSMTPEAVAREMWAVWRSVLQRQEFVTSDDFWAALSPELRTQVEDHSNAVGKMVNESAQQGWIQSTGEVRKTKRPSGQARNLILWRSRIYRRRQEA